MHHVPTGRSFTAISTRNATSGRRPGVHGLTASPGRYPPFAAIADELIGFIGGDRLVIHNADFDLAFLNAELPTSAGRAGRRSSTR